MYHDCGALQSRFRKRDLRFELQTAETCESGGTMALPRLGDIIHSPKNGLLISDDNNLAAGLARICSQSNAIWKEIYWVKVFYSPLIRKHSSKANSSIDLIWNVH